MAGRSSVKNERMRRMFLSSIKPLIYWTLDSLQGAANFSGGIVEAAASGRVCNLSAAGSRR